MEIKLQKWGNSNGIRIPKNIIDDLNIKENDRLEIVKEENKIIITKKSPNYLSLKERIEAYSGRNLAKDFDWGEPVGKEIW